MGRAAALKSNAHQKDAVGYQWNQVKHGGEVHKELGQYLELVDHSKHGYKALSLLAPEPERCNCRLERFDQYAVCSHSFQTAKKAMSLGVNGYDPWGSYVQRQHALI